MTASTLAQILAESEKLHFLETSALKNVNVEQAFTVLLTDIYKAATQKTFAPKGWSEKDLDGTRIELTPEGGQQRGGLCSWSCCGAVMRMIGVKSTAKDA